MCGDCGKSAVFEFDSAVFRRAVDGASDYFWNVTKVLYFFAIVYFVRTIKEVSVKWSCVALLSMSGKLLSKNPGLFVEPSSFVKNFLSYKLNYYNVLGAYLMGGSKYVGIDLDKMGVNCSYIGENSHCLKGKESGFLNFCIPGIHDCIAVVIRNARDNEIVGGMHLHQITSMESVGNVLSSFGDMELMLDLYGGRLGGKSGFDEVSKVNCLKIVPLIKRLGHKVSKNSLLLGSNVPFSVLVCNNEVHFNCISYPLGEPWVGTALLFIKRNSLAQNSGEGVELFEVGSNKFSLTAADIANLKMFYKEYVEEGDYYLIQNRGYADQLLMFSVNLLARNVDREIDNIVKSLSKGDGDYEGIRELVCDVVEERGINLGGDNRALEVLVSRDLEGNSVVKS